MVEVLCVWACTRLAFALEGARRHRLTAPPHGPPPPQPLPPHPTPPLSFQLGPQEAFKRFTTAKDIGIILINQHIADDIRHLLNAYEQMIPTVLEIPSKEKPYDPNSDYIMKRVNMFLGR